MSPRSTWLRSHSTAVLGLVILFVLLAGWSVPGRAAPPEPESIGYLGRTVKNTRVITYLASGRSSALRVAPPAGFSRPGAQNAVITVNYLSGANAFGDNCSAWPEAARAAFGYAANIWASQLNSTVPIVINACWANLEAGVLGYSGAYTYHADFSGAPAANTWFPAALANALAGFDLNDADGRDDDGDGRDTDADMEITYNNDYHNNGWYYGLDGNPGASELDFVTVVLHEITHGLGFAGSMQVSNGIGSWGYGTPPRPEMYDRFAENGAGQSLIAAFANPSYELGSQLTGGNIYFNGPYTRAANGGSRAKLFAPSYWMPGSSYVHLDDVTYNGTLNALMTHSLDYGEAIHDPGAITRGILQDVGWSIVQSAEVSVVKSVNGNLVVPPGQPVTFNLVVRNNGSLVAYGVVVSDVLPAAILNPSWQSNPPVASRRAGTQYVWDLPDLDPAAQVMISIQGTLSAALPDDYALTNTAQVSTTSDDTNLANNSSSVTIRGRSLSVHLPFLFRVIPSGPQPGHWSGPYSEDFYVTPDAAYVDEFSIVIGVQECGIYLITHTRPEPIVNNRFAFSGPFYASGTFDTPTTVGGVDGLEDFFISDCGWVSGGPWDWTASWQDASQPMLKAERSQPDSARRAPADVAGYRVTRLVAPRDNP